MRPTSPLQHAGGSRVGSIVVPATNRKTSPSDRKSTSIQCGLLLGRQTLGLGNFVGEAQSSSGENLTNCLVHHYNSAGRRTTTTVVGFTCRMPSGGAPSTERSTGHRSFFGGLRTSRRPGTGTKNLARACSVSFHAPANSHY